jgi:hypothetical protein
MTNVKGAHVRLLRCQQLQSFILSALLCAVHAGAGAKLLQDDNSIADLLHAGCLDQGAHGQSNRRSCAVEPRIAIVDAEVRDDSICKPNPALLGDYLSTFCRLFIPHDVQTSGKVTLLETHE